MEKYNKEVVQSYGIIPIFQNKEGKKEYLIVQNHGGFWGFPKGGSDESETAEQTAIREALEETGIKTNSEKLREPISYTYEVGPEKSKKVTLFPVFVDNKTVTLQENELQRYEWVNLDQALKMIDLDNLKHRLLEIEKYNP